MKPFCSTKSRTTSFSIEFSKRPLFNSRLTSIKVGYIWIKIMQKFYCLIIKMSPTESLKNLLMFQNHRHNFSSFQGLRKLGNLDCQLKITFTLTMTIARFLADSDSVWNSEYFCILNLAMIFVKNQWKRGLSSFPEKFPLLNEKFSYSFCKSELPCFQNLVLTFLTFVNKPFLQCYKSVLSEDN